MGDQHNLATRTRSEKMALNLANDLTPVRGRVQHRHANIRCLGCEILTCLAVQIVRGLNEENLLAILSPSDCSSSAMNRLA